jgi:type I restriction enzyme S subunit
MNVPKLRFPEFREMGEWEEGTLVQLAKFRRGSFPQPYGLPEWYDDENGMPFVQVFDVDENLLLKGKTKNKISKLGAEQSVFIAKGTLIVTLQGSIGRVAITQYDAYIDRTLLIFEEFFKPTEKLFFAYVIQSLFEIEKEKAPGGIIKTITKESLSNFVVNLPSYAEQQKIANCLSSLDELVTAETQTLEAYKQHKKGLMQQLFPQTGETTPRMRFVEFLGAGEWEESKLSGLIDTITPPQKLSTASYKMDGEYPIIDQSQSYICGWTNNQDALITDDLPLIIFGDHTCILKIVKMPFAQGADGIKILKAKGQIDALFLYQYLKFSPVVMEEYKRHFSILKEKLILFPKIDTSEQQKIANCLSSLDELITAQTRKIDALKTHKKGLMQGLFPNPSEEV